MPTILIPATTPPQTAQIGNETVYLEPRISANQLAQFIISDPAKQETIVREAMHVLTARVANYSPARSAIIQCHTANGLDSTLIAGRAARMRGTVFSDPFDTKCNNLSAAAFDKLAGIASQIDCPGQRIHAPSKGFSHLVIEGVRVSIQPEIVVKFAYHGAPKFGGVIFNFSKGEKSSLTNRNKKHRAGDYAAVLVFLMLGVHFGAQGGPRSANCIAVDAYKRKIFTAPTAHKMMLRNIEAACRNIARQWQMQPAIKLTPRH